MQHFGVSQEDAKHLSELDEAVLAKMERFVSGNPALRWKVMQRGYWVHGVDNFRDFLRAAEPFTMDGRAELIHGSTLLTMAEKDGLGANAPAFLEALHCPKTLLRFYETEGAGGHCGMQNRSLLNRRVLDWLDEQFGV